MSGKKGMKHYPASFKAMIVKRYNEGESIHLLSRDLGVSRWAIHTWCGLQKEQNLKAPKKRGRPRTRPITNQHEMTLRIKELEREIELYRSFLQAAGRM